MGGRLQSRDDRPLRGQDFASDKTMNVNSRAITIDAAQQHAIDWEELVGPEWAEWYSLTPQQRWSESMKMWNVYLALGGSLDPEPDSQSPFFDGEEWRTSFADGRPGMRVLRRSGV